MIQSSLPFYIYFLSVFLTLPQKQFCGCAKNTSGSISSLPSSYLLMGLTLTDQKSDLCKTNALRSEWSGAQLESPHFLLYHFGQLGHLVYNAPVTISIFTVLCMCSMESTEFRWNILYIHTSVISSQSTLIPDFSYLWVIIHGIPFMRVHKGAVFIPEFENIYRVSIRNRTEFLTLRNIHFTGAVRKQWKEYTVCLMEIGKKLYKAGKWEEKTRVCRDVILSGVLFYISARIRMKLGNKPCSIWGKQILIRRRDSIPPARRICWRGSDISRKAKDNGENKAKRRKNWRQ